MKTNLMLLTLSVTLIFSACQKGKTNITPDESFESLGEYVSAKIPAVEILTFSEGNGTLTTPKGSKITIPPNSFVSADGSPFTGDVNIEIKEIFERSEMMFSGAFPVSDGVLLNSGGMFDIGATSDGVDLRLADGAEIVVEIPAQAEDPDMQLFFAAPFGEDDPNGAAVNWEVVEEDSAIVLGCDTFWVDTLPGVPPVAGDTLCALGGDICLCGWDGAGGGNWEPAGSGFEFNSADGTYEITLDSLGWGNIDVFEIVNYFPCTFNLLAADLVLDNSNTTAFAVFTGQNAVWPVGSWGAIENNVISENHLADVPFNLVVISVVDNQLYSGILDVTPEPNTVYDVEMSETSSADLDEVIMNLP